MTKLNRDYVITNYCLYVIHWVGVLEEPLKAYRFQRFKRTFRFLKKKNENFDDKVLIFLSPLIIPKTCSMELFRLSTTLCSLLLSSHGIVREDEGASNWNSTTGLSEFSRGYLWDISQVATIGLLYWWRRVHAS